MDIEQMIAIVQIYIHHRKDKEVQISPPRNARQLALLIDAYNTAISWLNQNGFKQYV